MIFAAALYDLMKWWHRRREVHHRAIATNCHCGDKEFHDIWSTWHKDQLERLKDEFSKLQSNNR